MRPAVRSLIAAAAIVLAACDGGTDPLSPPPDQPPPPPPPPPALGVGTWALTQAGGQALPAYVAQRLIDGRFEEVWVDSAFIDIRQDGSWAQRIHMRDYLDDALQWRTTWVDQGTSRVDGSVHRFDSYTGLRSATVEPGANGTLAVLEKMVLWPGAGLVQARYVPYVEPPVPGDPQTGAGSYRAQGTDKGPLPQSVYFFVGEPGPGGATMFQLDSAVLSLKSDSTYVRKTFYSEWQAPDYRAGGPFTLSARYIDFDRGNYARTGDAIAFSSEWIQNQTNAGTVLPDGRIRFVQALSPGDPTFDVYYVRE